MVHFLPTWALTLKVILFMGMISQLHALIGSQLKMDTEESPHLISKTANPWKLPCPEPEDIQPCICSIEEISQMTMDCSEVTSEKELKSILNQDFSFPNFKTLLIDGNDQIKTIRKGDLGNCSFEEIVIDFSSLTEIEEGALEGSNDTLRRLQLEGNNLTEFFDISHFTRLLELDISQNEFQHFPRLVSSTVNMVYFNNHQLEDIPVDALKSLPALKEFEMMLGPLTSVPPGTFTFKTQLQYVSLRSNNLTTLPKSAVELHGNDNSLDLSDNLITRLPKESFSGINGIMSIDGNLMKELDEVVWRPLLENNVTVYLEENPFGCGCDVAWLILNTTLLNRLADQPTCYNGELFTDLDPVVYEDLC